MKSTSPCVRPHRLRQTMMRWLSVGGTLALSGIISGLIATPTRAAERIVFTFGIFGRSLSIEELTTFAETGEASSTIRNMLRLGNIDVETFRTVLTEEVTLKQRTVDRAGNSRPGEYLLGQIGNTFHTRSRQANVQALRGTLLIATSGDNKISILEFLQTYPTAELYVDGRSLLRFVRDVNNVKDKVQSVVTTVEDFLQEKICNCDQ